MHHGVNLGFFRLTMMLKDTGRHVSPKNTHNEFKTLHGSQQTMFSYQSFPDLRNYNLQTVQEHKELKIASVRWQLQTSNWCEKKRESAKISSVLFSSYSDATGSREQITRSIISSVTLLHVNNVIKMNNVNMFRMLSNFIHSSKNTKKPVFSSKSDTTHCQHKVKTVSW